jgi:hypothetical protein
MKPVVAPLSLGVSFPAQPAEPALMKLGPDGRLLLEAKHLRLSGQLSRSLEQFQRFEREYAGSRLRPLAVYLHGDALFRAGRITDAMNKLGGVQQVRISGRGDHPWKQLNTAWVIQRFDGKQTHVLIQSGDPQLLRFILWERMAMPLKSESLCKPLVEEVLAPQPHR